MPAPLLAVGRPGPLDLTSLWRGHTVALVLDVPAAGPAGAEPHAWVLRTTFAASHGPCPDLRVDLVPGGEHDPAALVEVDGVRHAVPLTIGGRSFGRAWSRFGVDEIAALGYARPGDVLVVHTLDRLGRAVRGAVNPIHDLAERGVGVKNLAGPITVDSSNPGDPMEQPSVVLLALFARMERTCTAVRTAHAVHLRDQGDTIAQVVATTGIPRTGLYRHLPPRPAASVAVDGAVAAERDVDQAPR